MTTNIDLCLCINLERRPDRLQQFDNGIPNDWPFPQIKIMTAIDGNVLKNDVPIGWPLGLGSLGCFRSHQIAIEVAIARKSQAVLILEDDSAFCDNFSNKARAFMSSLPHDWDIVYLGGEHMEAPSPYITEHAGGGIPIIEVPNNVRRTHAYVVHNRVLEYLSNHLWTYCCDEIDLILWDFIATGWLNVYSPNEWLVNQRAGKSDIQTS